MSVNLNQQLENYAELIVKLGLNLQAGQRLLISSPIDAAPLVRLLAKHAYSNGARLVDVIWGDDQLRLTRFQYAPRDSFEEFPEWQAGALMQAVNRGDAFLQVVGTNPDLLKEQDPDLIAIAQKTALNHFNSFNEATLRLAINWAIVSYPIASWAAKVFPNDAPDDQVSKLWDAIFKVCRLNDPDPIAAWASHVNQLVARALVLNAKQYRALKLTAPGTDLWIGLPQHHIWRSARAQSQRHIPFIPNLPTEEVFTSPNKDMTEGIVTATKPLNYGGTLIQDFSLTFEKGRVVKLNAAQSEATLRKLIETDDGARRLDEVALVPHNSPIAQSNLLFYNTLFDENASSHIAVGKAFKFCFADGEQLSDEEFTAAGGNTSLTHVDFMIGSGQMNVDGVMNDGSAEPLMRDGEWAFAIKVS